MCDDTGVGLGGRQVRADGGARAGGSGRERGAGSESEPGEGSGVFHEVDAGPVVPLEPVEAVEVLTLVDNTTDLFLPDEGVAKRAGLVGPRAVATMEGATGADALVAEHGFSALVTVTKAGTRHRILFDTGTSPDGMVANMDRLGVDPAEIEAVVLSHGHFDHTTGLDGLVRRLGRASLPVVIHPHFWRRRRIRLPGREPYELPTTSRTALEGAGFAILEEAMPSFLLDGAVLVTGEVGRTSGYEPGFGAQDAWVDGRWEADPLVLDDQALVVDVAGKGLVVLTGCGHAGVVNICRHARRLAGGRPLYAVVGGFHLNGPAYAGIIPRVLEDLAAMEPAALVPTHCSGWRAQFAMAARLPEAYVANVVGTRLEL